MALLCGALGAPLRLRSLQPLRRRAQALWPPPGGPASKPHCVSVTAVTREGWKLPPAELRISKCKGKYEDEVAGWRPCRASLTRAPYYLPLASKTPSG
ncbi:hypothetical protein KGG73_gp77 [Streptomyces phage Sentinel]|uniref:Uncharacterized protein n=1 Tax=Streptomyces phage Sentinel TaxID=2767584 RepID=A0A873WQG1_9CAUD|nr:hypothetical protein KGG73_gp77 [Streptomyces phage Sentinel]QPB09911.1 hypothetical protein CPT_Sentinel_077 [Streptomyces phage Sentinel]